MHIEKLSLYIITLNEERRLPAVLESVKGLVDEIVIVDSGSTDRTEEISTQVEDIRIGYDGTITLSRVHLVLMNYERDARSEIVCDLVIRAPSAIRTVDEVVLVENWERIG